MIPKKLTSQVRKPPVAPPVYRPQSVPTVLQGKSATAQTSLQPKSASIAPPVYRPQPTPKVLQTKAAPIQSRQAGQPPRQPVAAALNRAPEKRTAQPKTAANPSAKVPPVYRPSSPLVQRQTKAPIQPANTTQGTARNNWQHGSRYSTIQRTIRILYSGAHAAADINPAGLRTDVDHWANVGRPLSAAEKGALKAAISAANTANSQTADVPTMATAIVGHYANWAVVSEANKSRIKGILEQLMGGRLATGMTTAAEQTAFDDLITRATRTSRAKGQPNEIAMGNLPVHLAAAVRTQVNAAKARDASFHDRSQRDIKKIYRRAIPAELDALREAASRGLAGIRMVHFAGDGWLPTVDPNPIANFGTLGRALTADEISQAHWYQYALSAGGASAFIEFDIGTVSGIGGWRLIFDYVNRNFYLSLHYNWHSGYNPFFKLTDA